MKKNINRFKMNICADFHNQHIAQTLPIISIVDFLVTFELFVNANIIKTLIDREHIFKSSFNCIIRLITYRL